MVSLPGTEPMFTTKAIFFIKTFAVRTGPDSPTLHSSLASQTWLGEEARGMLAVPQQARGRFQERIKELQS